MIKFWIFYVFLFTVIIFVYSTPICDESYGYVEVGEDTAVGTVIKEIKCSPSIAGPGKLSFVIKDGNIHGKFGVNTTNDIGKVYVYQSISYESRTIKFQLSIEVTENGPVRSTTNYVLDIQITGINDYAPLFLFSPYTVYVNEDKQPGSIIFNPIPYDFDKGDDGATTSLILDGDDALFYMDPNTAKVYLRSYLDFERKSSYVLTIQVTDNGVPQRRSSTTLLSINVKDINDNAPVCEESYVTENFDETKEAGSVIKFLKCTDADTGNNGRLSYTITDGDYTKFRLQGPYLVLSKEIDVDLEPNVWSLTVVVRDRGNPRLSAIIDIVIYVEGVDDNAPVWAPPENGKYVVDIEEHSAVGKLVVRVSADDLDKDEHDAVVVYYMDDYSSIFTIKPTTGDIFLSQELDHEENGGSYTIPVSAVSYNNPLDRVSTNVIINVIDINDNTPLFSKDVFQVYVSEDLPAKSEMATVTATDSDAGLNGVIQYKIIGGNTDSLFDIQSKTGVISLMGDLDFENKVTHTVYLRASDKGRPSRWSTCTVIISVLPVNEFAPIFKEIETILIPEDTTIGASVFTVSATDNDFGTDGVISYEIGPNEERFAIESRTGVVRLLQTLDRETEDNFNIEIIASDMSDLDRKSGSVIVNIKVLDRNDNPPICENSFYSNKLVPPTSSGDVVQTLVCFDVDEATNSKLSYTVISGNTNNDFSMSADGNLVVMQKPSSPEYRLEIQVNDNGNPSLETFVMVVIKIGGIPNFINLPKSIQIPEGISIGSPIFQVKAESVSQQLEFSIKTIMSDGKNVIKPIVKIDRISGNVFTWSDIDREETDNYFIVIGVKESVSGKEIESTLELTVLDENDNIPIFDKSFYNVSLMENTEAGTELIKLSVFDADLDENSAISLKIIKGNEGNYFVIDKNGVIKTRAVVDRERNDFFTLLVTATDKGKKSFTGSATVLIAVLDADEYTPMFINAGSDLETSLPENTPIAAKIFAVQARDLDVHKKVTYDIDENSKEHFIIEHDSGEIFLARLLDRETQDMHTLIVIADGNGKSVTASVTLSVSDVNDNDPVFSSNIYKFTVSERSKTGDLVGTIVVKDADIGENALISTSITNGNRANAFVLQSDKLLVSGNLNFELLNEYLLEIEARDSGYPQRTSTASILIEITPEYRFPKFAVDLEVIHIPENVHVGNSIYDADGTLKGAREGHGNDLMYAIEDGNENGFFSISWNTGEITIARKLEKNFDKNVFMLLLISKNIYKPSLSDRMTLKVEIDDVNDNKPKFEKSMYSINIKENLNIGVSFGSVTAIDLDKAQNAFITYSLIQNEDAETFRIDPFVGTLSLKKELNFMYNTNYQLSVIAFDNGSPRLTGSTYVNINVIDVNDKPPLFEEENPVLKVRENYALGRTIYQVRAHDGDTGVGGELLYRIVKGNDNGTFELDSETGELTVAKQLDRESENLFVFVVEAEDKGTPSFTGTTTLSIIITDVNDNSPYFTETSYEVSLDRFLPVESHILSITALDSDFGDNALLEYLISQEHDELFQIDAKSGHIFTFSDLTEIANYIELVVIVKDRGIPRLSSSTTVLVDIYPPLVTETEDFSFEVSEYASPNTFVGTVASSTLTSSSRYSILSGNYKKHFRISEEDGNIFLNNVLDRESYADYYLQVKSTHKLSQNIQTDIYVHISVKDENDNFPKFEKQYYSILVLEHTPIGFSVGSIVANDLDDGNNGRLTYSIKNGVEGNADKIFDINENGTLIVQASISYEAIEYLNFTVIAKDNGQYSRQGSCEVNIQVVDVDESVVTGSKSSVSNVISLEMPASTHKGFVVDCLKPEMFGLNISAKKVSYLAQSGHNIFSITADTGCIKVNTDINLHDGESFLIWVVAVLLTPDKARGRLALIRVDTYTPNKHVVVFTHSVSKDVLDISRDLLLDRLQDLFPSNQPRLWKTDDLLTPVRRKLLFQGSKSYIYIIRGNDTDSISEVKSRKQFLLQNDILSVLRGPEGGVSHELTSELFDTFPVVSVDPYKDTYVDETKWIHTKIGKFTVGITVAFAFLALLIAVIIYWTKKKNKSNTVNAERTPKPSLSVLPNTNKFNPKYSNLRRASSTADLVPLVNALKILSGMTEEQRNKLIETTLGSKETQTSGTEKNEASFKPKFLTNKMKTLPFIKVSHLDEGNESRKLSQDDAKCAPLNNTATSKQSTAKVPIVSEPITPFSLNTAATSAQTAEFKPSKEVDAGKKIASDVKAPSMPTLAVPDDDSLSSLDLDSTDLVNESASDTNNVKTAQSPKVNNGPIIIGGKEYDGVGKDVTSGKKYLYNTRTGDKIYVTDEILKGAVEKRESVVTNVFNERHDAKMSTFKRPPIRRKTSRTRFSTTTIWEMNVDLDPNQDGNESLEDNVFDTGSKTDNNELQKDSNTARQRRTGVAYSKGKQSVKFQAEEKQDIDTNPQKKDSATSIESIKLDNDDKGEDKNELKDENIIEDTATTDEKTNNDEVIHDEKERVPDTKTNSTVKTKFVRPIYKPLNLENVTCKVPKGKSDKKDCLSKDPFYAGWAKMVGKRVSTKTVKRSDGPAKTVTVRQGRSLPANIAVPLLSNQVPIYKPKRLMTLDIP